MRIRELLPIGSVERRVRSISSLGAIDLERATAKVRESFSETPVQELFLPGLSSPVQIKLESKLPTGSFKVRGALHFLSAHFSLGRPERHFIAASTGNHGLALAWAAQKYACKVTIVVPMDTTEDKVLHISGAGAEVIRYGRSLDEALSWCRRSKIAGNARFVPSFDPDTILGHATLGAELFALKRVPSVLCFPIGLGSGVSGVAFARDILSPSTKIVGIVPETCPAWKLSWDSGRPVACSAGKTIAQGLRTECPDNNLFRYLRPRLDSVLVVSEVEIMSARDAVEKEFGSCADATGVVGLAGAAKIVGSRNESNVATVVCGLGRSAYSSPNACEGN